MIGIEKPEDYVEIIQRDVREKILKETPTVYETDKIERIYEFYDGATVKYEWQNTPDGRTSSTGKFNHQFTLIKLPSDNSQNFELGVIKTTYYPTR